MSHLNFDIVSDFELRISNLCYIHSTTVENVRQITPFYAKQTQFQKWQNQHKLFCNNEICKIRQLVIQTKQTQFKANKAKNKPNLTQFKANSNPIID